MKKCILCSEPIDVSSDIALRIRETPNSDTVTIGYIHRSHIEDSQNLGFSLVQWIRKTLYNEWNKPEDVSE